MLSIAQHVSAFASSWSDSYSYYYWSKYCRLHLRYCYLSRSFSPNWLLQLSSTLSTCHSNRSSSTCPRSLCCSCCHQNSQVSSIYSRISLLAQDNWKNEVKGFQSGRILTSTFFFNSHRSFQFSSVITFSHLSLTSQTYLTLCSCYAEQYAVCSTSHCSSRHFFAYIEVACPWSSNLSFHI